jgi:proteasome accessory factor B
LSLLNERYSIPKNFSVARHFGNAWTMIPGEGRDNHVVVRFTSFVSKNVEQVNWHSTQHTKLLPDGSLLFEATVSGLTEIVWWIIGYGDQAEVLRPLKLRKMVAQRARNMAAKYGGDS